jgi:hypothetical protein
MHRIQNTAFLPQPTSLEGRTVKSVPFVELFGGRLQGVVSSGSDPNRVYVAFIEAGTGDFNCSTNNNRPCGGMYASGCKHIREMVEEATLQFGAARVAQFLKLKDPARARDAAGILAGLSGKHRNEKAGEIFSRFLGYLRYCELRCEAGPHPEMSWFA